MKRRTFMAGLAGLPVVAMVRPDTLPQRKAVFEEIGDAVRLTLALPSLVRQRDEEALASIDSGFDTTLRYTLRLWQYGSRDLVQERTLVVKIRRDPWKKLYLVSTRDKGRWRKQWFETRDAAIDAAVTLERVEVAQTRALGRGEDGPYYFVEVLALRNPIKRRGTRSGREAAGRSRGRDLEWFGRLVEMLAGERALAEDVVHIRTNPFFLVPR